MITQFAAGSQRADGRLARRRDGGTEEGGRDGWMGGLMLQSLLACLLLSADQALS